MVSTIIVTFIWISLFFLIWNIFGNENLFLISIIFTSFSLLLFYISHIVFVCNSTSHFNLIIDSLKIQYFALYKNICDTNEREKLFSLNDSLIIEDITDKKVFNERFYKRFGFLRILENPFMNDEKNFEKFSVAKYYAENKTSYDQAFKSSFLYNCLVNKKSDEKIDKEKFSKIYKNYFEQSREFLNIFDTFKSVLGTNIYISNIFKYEIKKYFFLFIYFISFEIFLFSPFMLTNLIWKFGLIQERVGIVIFAGVGALCILAITIILFALLWKYPLKQFLKYTELYALRKSNIQLLIINELSFSKEKLSNPLVFYKSNFELLNIDFLQSKNIVSLEKNKNFTNLKNKIQDKEKFSKNFENISKLINNIAICSFVIFQLFYFMFYLVSVKNMIVPKKYDWSGESEIIFLVLIPLFVFSSFSLLFLWCKVYSVKKDIESINLLFNQNFSLPHISSYYTLPVPLVTSRTKIHDPGITTYCLSIIYWNFDEKRGINKIDVSERSKLFADEVELLVTIFLKKDWLFLYLKNVVNSIEINNNRYLLSYVLDGYNDYPSYIREWNQLPSIF